VVKRRANRDFVLAIKTSWWIYISIRDPEEIEKEEKDEKPKDVIDTGDDRWGGGADTGAQGGVPDWAGEPTASVPAIGDYSSAAPVVQNWAQETEAEWAASANPQQQPAGEWGGGGHDSWQ